MTDEKVVTLEEVAQAYSVYLDLVEGIDEQSVHKAFVPVFEANPDLAFISWYQYVPGYNDGEPCTFGVGELAGVLHSATKDASTLVEESSDDEEIDFYANSVDKLPKEMGKQITAVFDLLNEDMLEGIFGSNARVVITKDKITVHE